MFREIENFRFADKLIFKNSLVPGRFQRKVFRINAAQFSRKQIDHLALGFQSMRQGLIAPVFMILKQPPFEQDFFPVFVRQIGANGRIQRNGVVGIAKSIRFERKRKTFMVGKHLFIAPFSGLPLL
jgi:hypothetical protein